MRYRNGQEMKTTTVRLGVEDYNSLIHYLHERHYNFSQFIDAVCSTFAMKPQLIDTIFSTNLMDKAKEVFNEEE